MKDALKKRTSLENALTILRIFSIDHPEWSTTDIAKELGIAKSTAHRLLLSLSEVGFVIKDHYSKLYSLGSTALSLTTLVQSQIPITHEALPILNKLTEFTGESAHLSILEGSDIFYLQTINGVYEVEDAIHLGKRHPAFCTSSGQAILAFHQQLAEEASHTLRPYTSKTILSPTLFSERLEYVRKNGYSFCVEEYRDNTVGIAAPVYNEKGDVFASLNVTSTPKRAASSVIQKKYISAVKEAAGQLSNIVSRRKRALK
ncbi:IclR family transcriptional regulator [Domibacillus robiginosus]|uniref:IclR family transcriptional regulator n=1 Tax=Domibacillus robiginosus TaxID=1071054 RepID=UPI00067C2407|nr:IclR family transcriptional regulator [Domibacillus robiginosus]